MKLPAAPRLPCLLSLLLCAPLPAAASRFTVETPAALELATGERQISALADVRLTTEGIESAFGIRLDRLDRLDRRGAQAAPLMTRLPLVLDARYVVKDRNGVLFRLIVHSVIGTRMGVELLGPGESPARPSVLDLDGPYRLRSFTIDGARAATAYPDLELSPDGRYRLGGGFGRWRFDGYILSLDGYYGRWGPADVSADGRAVTFRYFRGSRLFQVTFARPPADPPPENVAALERPPG